MKDPQLALEHLRKLAEADPTFGDGMMLALLRRHFTGEPDAAKSCPSGSEGAGRKRTSVMMQRAALRPYLHRLEEAITQAAPRKHRAIVVRYADDLVRHEARYVHGARAPTIGRRVVSLSP
jgi:hypothetical protein